MFLGYDDDATGDDGYDYSDDDKSDEDDGYKDDSEGCYVNRRFENHAQGHELLAELVSQRENGEFLDVVVQIEGREFPCHRAVLASTRYFKTMLSSDLAKSNSKVVQLNKVDSTSFSKILDFLYTGKIIISKDDVQDILQTAHMLLLDKIVEYCREFIQDNLCPSNCLGVMCLADLYGFAALKKEARDMVMSNFPEVTEEEVFLYLSVEELADLLGDEQLKVTNEDDVVDSVIRWLDKKTGNHQTAILRILQQIRLPCVRVSVLQKLESHPLIQASEEFMPKIIAAKEKHLLGTDVEGEDESSHRHGTSDNLAIMVGGWKTVKRPHSLHEQPVRPQATPLQSIICLDPDREQYYHITTLPTPASGYMSVTSAGRHLYVTGGRVHPLLGQGPHSAPSRQAFRYDFPSDTWLRLPDMPRGRAGHQSVVVDGKLFVVGGDAETTSLVTMDCYDPVEGAWIQRYVRPLLHTSSTFEVTAFRDKVVFIEMQESAEDRPIDGDGVLMPEAHSDTLCVHSLDVKTNVWRHANIYEPSQPMEYVDILATTTVNDKLYIRFGTTPYGSVYIFDAEEKTLIRGSGGDWKENILLDMIGLEGIVGSVCNYDYGRFSTRQTPLPFALFGHSFLQTSKSRVGWYCRDLAVLEKEDKESDDESIYSIGTLRV